MRPKDQQYEMIKTEYRAVLGKRLKKARKEAGLTQEEVWEKLQDEYGYTSRKSLISSYERGYRMPPIDVFAKLSEIYGKDPKEILFP